MGKIENQVDQVQCPDHPENSVIWQCDVCGRKMCKECKTIGFQYKIYCDVCIDKINTAPKKVPHPAGFWARVGARVFDILVLSFLNLVLFLVAYFFFNPVLTVVCAFISYLVYVLYFTIIPLKVGQTPGKMAMEIEIVNADASTIRFFNVFLRHILGFIVGFFYVLGMLIFYNSLRLGMGTEHLSSLFDFLKEYHRFGISDTMTFFYLVLVIIMSIESLFMCFTRKKVALHDLWSGSRVILSF